MSCSLFFFFFFSSRRRHTRSLRDWSSDVCSSDLRRAGAIAAIADGDEANAGLDEPAGGQHFFAIAGAVAFADAWIFPRDIEGMSSGVAGQDIDSLALAGIHHFHGAARVEMSAHAV